MFCIICHFDKAQVQVFLYYNLLLRTFSAILNRGYYMSRCCDITLQAVSFGRNVSHAHNVTSRLFRVNIRKLAFHSDVLGAIHLYVSNRGLRTVAKYGGIDAYLKNAKCLTLRCLRLREALISSECAKALNA